eukprot:s2781_g11.t1
MHQGPLWKKAPPVTHYNIYLGFECTENITLSSVSAELVAVISGRMQFTFSGTLQQLQTAVIAALAQQLQVPISSIYVQAWVLPPTGRRLAGGTFSVDYVVVLSADEASSALQTLEAVRSDSSGFRTGVVVLTLLVAELLAAGAASDVVAALVITDIGPAALQFVAPEGLPSLLPAVAVLPNATETAGNSTEEAGDGRG